jgi:hypothetical protein
MHDHHESDLYLLATPEAWTIMKHHEKRGKIFRSEIDGKLYYDIPFAYDPWWIARTGRP